MAIRSLVIDRAKWLCGSTVETLGASKLRDDDGNMCCMGFYAAKCGTATRSMLDKFYFSDLSKTSYSHLSPKLRPSLDNDGDVVDQQMAVSLYELNDNECIDAAQRERELADAFKDHLGISLKFTGEYP